jgi:glyoxylase-like metal-dependent hydrolase (beta-lactamase superfamily II)
MKLHVIQTGLFKLDGGAMFGIIPRRMWEKQHPPDEKGLCTWTMRCLLIEIADRRILIDTGMGTKQDDKFRGHFLPHGDDNLIDSLKKAGFEKSDITDVFFTHLHFDHCGGAVERTSTGELLPTFPNAKYYSVRRHYNWALNPNEREKASFLKENFVPLSEAGRLKYVPEGFDGEFFPNVQIYFAEGHTESMMLPVIKINKKTVVFCADLLPSQWHIPMAWVMAYDIRPLVTLSEKAVFLKKAVANNWILFFEHDPKNECATLKIDDNGRIVLDKTGDLADFV